MKHSVYAVSLVSVLLLSGASCAQGVNPALKTDYDRAFQEMISDPGNMDKMFSFARIAADGGDYEGAIGALERMLIYNRNLPRVRLELGSLYYRLGSYELARSYFEEALATPGVPDEVKARAEEFLAGIDEGSRSFTIRGQVSGGVRYQTNANAGPVGDRVEIFGLPATISGGGQSKSDFSIFTAANLAANYDPGLQSGLLLESNANLYVGRQMTLTELSVTAAEIDFGPRYFFAPADKAMGSIRPYVLGSYISVGDNPYSSGFGGGVSGQIRLASDAMLDATLELRSVDYMSSSLRAALDERDGEVVNLKTGLSVILTPTDMIRGEIELESNNADADYERYGEVGATFTYSRQWPAPWEFNRQAWTTALQLGVTGRRYDAPDATIDPTERRRDREWFLGGSLQVPLREGWAGVLDMRYTNTTSNLPNYEYKDFAVTLATSYRF
ncbi:tetratricopeptide repeat protein [Lacibacterium aquatile]|uniref:Tetratricopeptide repeat protein n=1 Tax=Lacibacterium aquatile TaxID=1168082 RepID=A0ABW5DPY8_9PROT